MGWSEDAARNRGLGTKSTAEYSFGDVAGLDVVELGCGTASVSARLGRAGAPADLVVSEHGASIRVDLDRAKRRPAEEIRVCRKK